MDILNRAEQRRLDAIRDATISIRQDYLRRTQDYRAAMERARQCIELAGETEKRAQRVLSTIRARH